MKNNVKTAHHLDQKHFLVEPGKKIRLQDYPPDFTGGIRDKAEAKMALLEDVSGLAAAQDLLWASREYAIVIIFQALDAAGKDGTIKHVMSGVNPQGVFVRSFKAPSAEEKSHHFLWRPMRVLPGAGEIAIFNRSYYEEVLVVRVHPDFLDGQWLPPSQRQEDLSQLWPARYREINHFEEALTRNTTRPTKKCSAPQALRKPRGTSSPPTKNGSPAPASPTSSSAASPSST
jgi:polyphosphate kinase 2 (PPK2 family)